jgi:23S rRNA (adenine2503-C2)-methyltransferase
VLALQAVTPEELADALSLTLAEARKVVSAVHRGRWPAAALQGVRRVALEAAVREGDVPSLEVRSLCRSAVDPFVKLALRTADGLTLEAVRIPLEKTGRFSVCVSSQVGCALGCAFCATGRMGLARNLATWEIVEQVRLVQNTLSPGQRTHGVVFQGMGEPLANVERVIAAIRVLSDPSALAIDARAMTVSTAGLPAGIRRLAREVPKVRLAVSISSARPEVRRTLMPIEQTHPLGEVMDAVEQHARVTGLAPMWAVTPLSGVNDGEEDARALAELAKRFEVAAGVRPRISVVPYNTIVSDGAVDGAAGDPFARGSVGRFVDLLAARGLRPHLRYSGGADVAAACGQLAGKD